MATRKISIGDITAEIDPDNGGRITSLSASTTPLLQTQGESLIHWGLYPMAPYAGRVRNAQLGFNNQMFSLRVNAAPHSIHGTVLDSPWNIEAHDATSILMSTDTGPDWPFTATVTHHIAVSQNSVRCELAITAHEPMPAQLGWHPWFAQPREVSTSFNSMLRRDEDGITTLDRVDPLPPPVDDCFFEPNAWPSIYIGNYAVEVASDCPYWVRYDAPGGDVCIEPQSGPPNGINSKPLILEQGQQFSRWMELRISHQL
jgi:aldose 1-epimerase